MAYQPLTPEQFKTAKTAGFSADKIISMEQKRKAEVGGTAPMTTPAPAPATNVSQETPAKKGVFGTIGDIAKSAVAPVVTMLARPLQAGAELLGASPEQVNAVSAKVPVFGKNGALDVPQNFKDVKKDVGRGAETVALGLGPAAGGAAFGFGNSLEQGNDVFSAKTAIQTALGGVAGKALEFAAPAVGKVISKVAPQALKDVAGSIANKVAPAVDAVSDFAKNTKILPDSVSNGINKAADFVENAPSKALDTVKNAVKNQYPSAADAKVAETIQKGTPDASIATKTTDKAGNVVKDKIGAEAVRQGIPEADVAYIKLASDTDKAKMAKMLDIRQQSLTNKRSIARSSDVVGDTFLQHAKFIENTNKQAGKDLNMVAQRLAGKKIDPTEALTQFGNDLENSGIKVRGKTLNFKGSDFEGIGPSQTAIRNVYDRALRVAKSGDALEAHRLKKYIDEVVDYGKNAEGLSGRAQRMLKGLRHGVDGVLDKKFPTYNKFNTVFSDTIGEMNKIGDALGHSFKAGDTFANAKAGTAMRSILSNGQKRANMLQLLESMQNTSKKYGLKSKDDIVTQTLFADTIEKMFGSEAPTSLLGNVEKGVDHAGQVISAGNDLAKGNVVSGTIKAGKYLIDATRGVNQEAKINALKALLQGKAEPRGVFGKPVKK